MSLEFWTHARTLPRQVGPAARRAESEGWAGMTLGDSQNRSGDPYVALGTAIAATTTIRMSTGVTNPFTRHPVVTASAILSADIESGGRVELGVAAATRHWPTSASRPSRWRRSGSSWR